MQKVNKTIKIRPADIYDVELLAAWWANGTIMNHAGFPQGLNTNKDQLKSRIMNQQLNCSNDCLMMIIADEFRVGEMHYRQTTINEYEVGIKVCDFTLHNKSIGTTAMKLLLELLFIDFNARLVHLDTNLENKGAQRFYERLGFIKTKIEYDTWTNQVGEQQSVVYYELSNEEYKKRTY